MNQKFILTLDQQREPKEDEDLHVGATHAIAVDIDKLVEDLKIPDEYWMTLQIGSREHRREGLTGESWKVPVGDFKGRAAVWGFQPQSYSLDMRPKGANEQGVVLVRRFEIKLQKNQDVSVNKVNN